MRFVYAVAPVSFGFFLVTIGAGVGARLIYETGASWVRPVTLVIVVLGLAIMCWGVKEFWRPSSWRRQPEWVREYEARVKRRV